MSDARTLGETGAVNNNANGTAINNNNDGTLTYLPIHWQTSTTGSGTETSHAEVRSQTEYQELTTSEVNSVLSSNGWSTATTVDSTHAADLTFGFVVNNLGSDAVINLSNLRFSISFGPDVPEITWPPVQDAGIALSNLFPGRSKPDAGNFTAGPITLSLDQVRAIDEGAPIRISVADLSFGSDQQFYEDALGNAVLFHIDDGIADGDQNVDTYMVPTWGDEKYQDVLRRALDVGEYNGPVAGRLGNLVSLGTPEFDNNHNFSAWNAHAVGDRSWWDVSLSDFDPNITSLKNQPAHIRSHVFMSYIVDSDGDGYPDLVEDATGMDKNNAALHPRPLLIAAKRTEVNGAQGTIQLSLQNNGNFDASSVQAQLIAVDNSITVIDGFIGGGGRVRAGQRVVLGARISDANLAGWTRSTAKPIMTGQFTGSTPRTYQFSIASNGTIGVSGGLSLNWSNGATNASVNIGSGYTPLTPILIAEGVEVALTAGDARAGDSFSATTALPVDTFAFTINNPPQFTPPLVMVSYNDPEGNHKFITSIEVSQIQDDLTPYQAAMTDNLNLDLLTFRNFAPGANSTALIFTNPTELPLIDGNLFVEFATANGTVVHEDVFSRNLLPGPNVISYTWNTSTFAPTYNSNEAYRIMAFATDQHGTIIDTGARYFSTFAADPIPVLNTSPVTWNFGNRLQGEQVQQHLSIVNTGGLALSVVISSSNASLSLTDASAVVSIPPAGTRDVVAALDTTALSGTVAMSLTIRSNDPAKQTTVVTVTGVVSASNVAAAAFDLANKPWDKIVRIYTSTPQYAPVDFTENIQPSTVSIEPCKVLSFDGLTLKGTGKYCTDYGLGTVSYQIFGDGGLGPLTVTASPTIINIYAALNVTANAGQSSLSLVSNPGFQPNQEVMVHQTQGASGIQAGVWETNTIASAVGNNLVLARPLGNTYTQGGNSHAQVVLIPHYSDVLVQNGGLLTALAWDGSAGGLLVFRASGSVTVQSGGMIDVSAKGFRGGVTELSSSSYGYGGEGVAGISGSGGNATGVSPSGGGGNADGAAGGTSFQYYSGGGGSGRAQNYGNDESSGGGGGGGHVYGGGGGASGVDSNTAGQSGGAAIGFGGGHGGDDTTSHGNGVGAGGNAGGVNAGSSGFSGVGGAGHTNRSPGGGGGGSNYPDSIDGSTIVFGGGGGAGSRYEPDGGSQHNDGGSGGGIVYIAARNITLSGVLTANGQAGVTSGLAREGGGGGGAGGYIVLIGQTISLGTNLVTDSGGVGAGPTTYGGGGGTGSIGRIHIEYQNINSGWATSPPADAQARVFYTAEKLDPATVRFMVPDLISNSQNYVMQFGRHFAYGVSGGTVMTPTRIAAQSYLTATMDALVTNVGAGGPTGIRIGIGTNPAVYSQTQTITQPTTIHIPITGTAISQYIAAQPVSLTIDVPFTVTIDWQADVILTNLALTPAPQVDLAVGGSDLAVGCPGAPQCLATEGNSVPLTVTVHNNGAQDVSAAVVSYYAGDPQNGGQLLGSSYFGSIPFGGSSLATFAWPTSGFTHTQTLYAVVDPPNAIPETFETNNTVSRTVTIRTKADMQVASLAFSATDRVVGERITATLRISNAGETASPVSALRLTTLGERGDAISSTVSTASVITNSVVSVVAPFTPTNFGAHVLTVTADINNAVNEFDESNNLVTATFFVGLLAPVIQAGDAGDPAYITGLGYGFLNGSTYDFGGGNQDKTVRFDGFGNLQYRFDGLQGSRFYHFDATFYEEGDTFTQLVLFNGIDSGIRIPMNSGAVKKISLIVPPSSYANTSTVVVSIQRVASSAAAVPSRFTPAGSSGASFVSELSLRPIEYTYIDAGSAATDLPYSVARGYGYLNGFASGSGSPTGTYRTSFTSTVYYQFDNLNPSSAVGYALDLTLFDSSGSTRQQIVSADGIPICGPYTLNGTLTPRCVIPSSTYASDGRVTIAISRTNGTGPLVNEISLEQQTATIANYALGQPATQSSTFGGAVASRAVDGNTDGNFGGGSVTSTGPDPQAWWQVDLAVSQVISNVQVWNRSDCCANRLSNFYVFVSDTPFASTNISATLAQSGMFSAFVTATAGTPSIVAVNRTGHYVRVQLNGADYLSLAEVQVLSSNVGGAGLTMLSSFSAQRGAAGVDIAWAAGSEYNLKSYDLYRSTDDALWSLVTQQPAGSNCQSQGPSATYRVNDPDAAAGQITYYRLVLNGDQCGAGHANYLESVVAQGTGGGELWQLWLPLLSR